MVRRIIIDCKTGKTKEIEDGLSLPEFLPIVEFEGLDLALAKAKLDELDELKAKIADYANLKARVAKLERRQLP